MQSLSAALDVVDKEAALPRRLRKFRKFVKTSPRHVFSRVNRVHFRTFPPADRLDAIRAEWRAMSKLERAPYVARAEKRDVTRRAQVDAHNAAIRAYTAARRAMKSV